MYLASIGEQGRIFLYACGFGFFLGFVFDVFEFIGEFFPKRKIFIIIRDVIYMIAVTFLMFLFSLAADDGSFKFYIYCAAAIGWFTYYFSLVRLTKPLRIWSAKVIKSFLKIFLSVVFRFFLKLKEKREKKLKKSENSSNLLLQDGTSLLYNEKESLVEEGCKTENGRKRKKKSKFL